MKERKKERKKKSKQDRAKSELFRPYLLSKVACVASVSVWFRSKEIPRKGTFDIDRARNETRAKK